MDERYIRTFVEKSRTVLLNDHARWPDNIDLEIWTFAIRHVVNQWNNTPTTDLNYQTSEERFNRIKQENANRKKHFQNFHLFGCPTYVLKDKLQGNVKQPKWKPRTKVGVYLGRSKHHAADVNLI